MKEIEGELLGDVITGIGVSYDKPASSGQFTAYFDGIELSINNDPEPEIPEKPIITGNIDSMDRNLSIRIYPNPAIDQLSIKIPQKELPVRFELMDLLGNRVISQQIDQPITTIPISGLAKGAYIQQTINEKDQVDAGILIIE